MRQTSDFETAAEILKTLDLSFDDDYENIDIENYK